MDERTLKNVYWITKLSEVAVKFFIHQVNTIT